MVRRVTTAGVGLLLTAGSIMAGPWGVTIFLSVLAALAAAELGGLLASETGPAAYLPPVLSAAVPITIMLFGAWAALGVVLLSIVLGRAYGTTSNRSFPVAGGSLAFIVLYCGLAPSHLLLVFLLPSGTGLLVLLLLTTWLNDSGAYLCGRAVGRRPLAPRLSPNKTVEGAACGVAVSVAGSSAFATAIGVMLFWPAVVFGGLVSVAGTTGDLFESWLKRRAGAKDSGSILPGHGGVLDRFDSLAFTAVAGFYFIILVQAGGRGV